MNLKIIGLGGIGSILSDSLCRFLNFSTSMNFDITLIDGDEYEFKNLERQTFHEFGNKAFSKQSDLISKYNRLSIKGFPHFINPENINTIERGDIVFLCVDNHKTRKIVSDHCSTLDDIILISGGNEIIDGNVQIYIRKDGNDITPSLTKYHPEIENYTDKLPSEMSCEELERSEPQLFFTNMMVACFMCCSFYNILRLLNIDENTTTKPFKISEIYFDIEKLCADSKYRNI